MIKKLDEAWGVVYLFVRDSFLHQREQFIGEEGCMGINIGNALRLIDVCHNLTHAHVERMRKRETLCKVNTSFRNSKITLNTNKHSPETPPLAVWV